jgi:putative membrane protein
MSRVMPITGALAVAVLAAAPGALAQVTSGRDSVVSPWPDAGRVVRSDTAASVALTDTAFIREAIRGNLTEVTLGRMAESRAEEDAVEEFAERMVSEHNSMNERWAELARDKGMRVVLDFGPDGQQTIARLEDIEGTEFDQAYMTEMIRDHEQDLAVYQRMGASARSPEVRQLANSGVSTIREHLALARQVGSRVGVSTTAGRAGGVTTPETPPSDDARRRTTVGGETRDERDDRDDRNDRGALRAEDRAFIDNVLQDHLMHIRLAERAKRQARRDETRQLAERIEHDFELWQDAWEDLAARHDLKPPSHLGRLHGQKIDRLARASRGNVDRTYAAIVAEHLASVVPYFQKEGQSVRPAGARRLVDAELPVIQDLLARARALQRPAGARAEDSDRR